MAVLAAVPLAVVLVLLTVARWSAARAGSVAFLLTLVIAVTAFDFGRGPDPFTAPVGLVGVAAETLFIAAAIVAIVGPALAVHHLQQLTGASDDLRAGLSRLSPDPRIAALLVAWFFALFLEGAAGFGTAIALSAPFLVAAGFSPASAVVAVLLGHAAGVSFGAIGTPILAQAASSGFAAATLARWTAPYHVILGWFPMAALVVTIARNVPGRPPWRAGGLAAVAFFVPYALIAFAVGPELPTMAGALFGLIAFVAIAVPLARRRVAPATALQTFHEEPPIDLGRVGRAGSPYLVLVVLVLATRLIPAVRKGLAGAVLEWEMAEVFSGRIEPLLNPGVLLAVAFLAGAALQRASRVDVTVAARTTGRQLVTVAAALVAMVGIARLMTAAGMTEALASAAADAGPAWPLAAPAVGALGTFVTGSATTSNILFTDLQVATARGLDLPVLPLLGAQSFGAGVGNLICPNHIVAAAATVGLTGGEGRVLRRTLPLAVLYVTLGGVLALVFVR